MRQGSMHSGFSSCGLRLSWEKKLPIHTVHRCTAGDGSGCSEIGQADAGGDSAVRAICRGQSSLRKKISSSGTWKWRAIFSAMMVDGTNRPTSMVLMVFRDTPIASASSAWLSRCSARKTRILLPSSFLIAAPRAREEQKGGTEKQQHEGQNALNDGLQRHCRKPFEDQVVQCLQYHQDQETQHPGSGHGLLESNVHKTVFSQISTALVAAHRSEFPEIEERHQAQNHNAQRLDGNIKDCGDRFAGEEFGDGQAEHEGNREHRRGNKLQATIGKFCWRGCGLCIHGRSPRL